MATSYSNLAHLVHPISKSASFEVACASDFKSNNAFSTTSILCFYSQSPLLIPFSNPTVLAIWSELEIKVPVLFGLTPLLPPSHTRIQQESQPQNDSFCCLVVLFPASSFPTGLVKMLVLTWGQGLLQNWTQGKHLYKGDLGLQLLKLNILQGLIVFVFRNLKV